MLILVTIVIVGVSAYVWCTRGFFSALIHLVCTFAAGAIAFGVYEPLGYFLLEKAPERGMFSFLGDTAWAIALGLPFALSLAILRGIADKILPANAQCETAVDYVGGGICGLGSGVIAAGIFVLSVGMLRLPAGFGGYQPVMFSSTARGSLEHNPELFVPWVDRLTAGLYTRLSLTTLRTAEPLAKWHPDLVSEVGAMRITYEDASRNTITPDGFNLLGWYTVGDRRGTQKLDDLLSDSWNTTPQKVTDLDGEAITSGYVAGFIVNLATKARERTGQVIIGNGQVRLVVQNTEDEDDTRALHPVAAITRVDDPARVDYARFRFDADSVFFCSVGGASETVFSFEFPIPTGYVPIALYVKGARHEIDPDVINTIPNYESPILRDALVRAGQMAGMGGVGPIIDPITGQPVQAQTQGPQLATNPVIASNALGFTISKGTEQSLEVVQADSGRGWLIVNGEQKLRRDQLAGFGGVDFKLRIDRIQPAQGTVIVQANITPTERSDEFNQRMDNADKSKAPVLVDNNGTVYEPVGFIFRDPSLVHIRYTTGSPIRSMTQLPGVSRSNPDKRLILIYAVSLGVKIHEMRVGDQTIEVYNPPISAEAAQR